MESGIADILERVLLRVTPNEIGLSEEDIITDVATYFNHQKKLSAYKGSSLILHAKNDSLVPSYHAENLYLWANDPKTIKLFPNGDHNSIFFENEKEYLSVIIDFINNIK